MAARRLAFVDMPYGNKSGPRDGDGKLLDPNVPSIDFDRVYRIYIAPALTKAGWEAFRADQEKRAGDIIPDMFQKLLVADLVVADITIDNPNVWYELGVRHGVRSRGVVIVAGRPTPAFDLYTNRKCIYRMKEWEATPQVLDDDIASLATMVGETIDAWHGRRISPVYYYIPNLQEPDWKSLKIGDAKEFWERHHEWEGRIDLARKEGRIGDLLVLANEAPVSEFRIEAWITAGKALRRAGRFKFALEHLQHGLDRSPDNLDLLREKGMCLERLGLAREPGFSLDGTRQHYQKALATYPRDSETWALLGRVDKDEWTRTWLQANPDNHAGRTQEQNRADAADADELLREAIESYATGYKANPGHYYSGINALTLMHLNRYLTQDPRHDAVMETMAGAVRFAAECESEPREMFWAKATLGDLDVLTGTPAKVTAAYKRAVAMKERGWFELNSSRNQLLLLKELGFQPEHVQAGIAVFDWALERLSKPTNWEPRQVILFSGHMVDTPTRAKPRFTRDMVNGAAARIAEELETLGANAEDLALCQAAAGGDLLFLEACQKRGVRCQVLLPFAEPTFIQTSVLPSADGEKWRKRYFDVKEALQRQPSNLAPASLRIMPDELGLEPEGVDPFERCNLWLLYTTLSWGIDRARLICLWNGESGDGPGGTEHMYGEVNKRTGRATWIDTRTLS